MTAHYHRQPLPQHREHRDPIPLVPEILAIDELLERLNQISPRQKSVVEMRFYAGFTEEEIAEIYAINGFTTLTVP